MFSGFNTSDPVNTLSLLCGFLIIFSGVYLLNLSRKDPSGDTLLGSAAPGRHGGFEDSAIPTDSMTAFGTRRSMQARGSSDAGRHSRTESWGSSVAGGRSDREALMHDFSLTELAEDSDDDPLAMANGTRRKTDEELGFRQNQHAVSMARLSGSGRARVETQQGRNANGGTKLAEK